MLKISSPADALTAEEALNKMNPQEQSSYLMGMIEMLSYSHTLAGEDAAAACVHDAYFGADADASWRTLYNNLMAHETRPPQAIIVALTRRHCGE